LTLYTSANDVYPIRVKAGQTETIHIDQPHLTLFGTATPQYFYEALCQRMLTNGFFARLIVVDVGRRGTGQTPGSARQLPEQILETARWWAEYQPSTGNLQDAHPDPRVVPFEPEVALAIAQLQRMTEAEYDLAEEAKNEVARTAWSRTCENATKLALVYACSENHETPVISLPAVQWATEFAMHQTRRQLFLASTFVAENPFHAECLKMLRKLRESDGQMARRQLMRAMRCKAADFDQIVSTFMQQGDIVPVEIPTRTRPALGSSNMSHPQLNPSQIRPHPSRKCDGFDPDGRGKRCQNGESVPNPSQTGVTDLGDGFVLHCPFPLVYGGPRLRIFALCGVLFLPLAKDVVGVCGPTWANVAHPAALSSAVGTSRKFHGGLGRGNSSRLSTFAFRRATFSLEQKSNGSCSSTQETPSCGNPQDLVEVLLIESLILAYHNAGRLLILSADTRESEAICAYTAGGRSVWCGSTTAGIPQSNGSKRVRTP